MRTEQGQHDAVLAHLADGRTSLVLAGSGGMPRLAYWGAALGPVDDALVAAFERPVPAGALDVDAPVGLVAEAAAGWFGLPGIEGHRADGSAFAPLFALVSVSADDRRAVFGLEDRVAGLELELAVRLDASGVVVVEASLTNTGADAYDLSALRLAFPLPGHAGELITVGGRWTNEFAQTRTPWDGTTLTVENRRGKTSHERLGLVFAGSVGFGERHGEVWGCHVGWSGNYALVADAVTDARRVLHAGELLGAGEVRLAPGERYRTPPVFLVHSATGLTAASQAFHRYLRSRPQHPQRPRPVLLNTWEAMYFDHRLDTFMALADRAASCGIERFVVDDGWFHLRRDDRAGLGDWWVDPVVWPQGLTPLIEHVRGLGMEFGLWVEPEMVNPDSDLYRAHPDWALVDHRYPVVTARNQLVLDLGRAEVRDHLFAHLDALLRDNDIAYLKWDMNRDLVAPTSDGRYSVHAQTVGVYELIDRLRAAHPGVEIESCASGGGRLDFGILERTERVWTSDSIDALDRQRINRGFSLLCPPELMGAHIGAPRSHTTFRTHAFAFRAATALFGHLGVEWNLLEASQDDLRALTEVIALHKRHRVLLHTGDVVRLDHPDPTLLAHGVVAGDGREALFHAARVASGPSLLTPPLLLAGLDPDRSYRVEHVPIGRARWGHARRQPAWVTGGIVLSGRQLALAGLHLPVLHPETSIVLHAIAM